MASTRKRNDPPAVSEAAPWWRQRWGVLLVSAICFFILLPALAGNSWPMLVLRLPVDGLFLTAWLAAAWGIGATLVRADALTKIALGLGTMSIAELLLGLGGFLHSGVAFAIVAIGLALLIFHAPRLPLRGWLTTVATSEWLWLIALPVLAMTVVAAYVPPGILWGDEPHGYDVLEYHLQLPREWYQLGRIVPLEHNVFSYFPLGVEMHYLLAMQLQRGPWSGMYLAQLMHMAFAALTVVAIYATATRFTTKLNATLAAIAAAYLPWLALLGPVAYNECGLLLFGTLAIAWLIREKPNAIIAGAFAGLAAGCKLTAVPLLIIIPPIVVVLLTRRLKLAGLFVLVAIATFSPWLIRNALWTGGNPVFPEAARILGKNHFTEDQIIRWHQANHAPGANQHRATAIVNQILADWRFGWLLLPAALLSLGHKLGRVLLAILLAWLIFWTGFTHLQSRFFTLAIPIAAVAIALLDRRILVPVAGIQILIGLVLTGMNFTTRVAPQCAGGVLGFEDFSKFHSAEIQDVINSSRAISLIGDARAFLYPVPIQRLHYRTVFDIQVKPTQTIIDAWADGEARGAFRIIDYNELDRFSRTYYGIPAPPPSATDPAAR